MAWGAAALHKVVGDSAGANNNQALTVTATTAGTMLWVGAVAGTDVHAAMAITDNGATHATWVPLISPTYDATLNKTYAVWVAYSAPAGITTVTVSYGASVSPRGTQYFEWSGADGTQTVDKSDQQPQTLATPSSPSVTPSTDNELVIGFGLANTSDLTPVAPFTGGNIGTNAHVEWEYDVQTTASAAQPSWTCTSQYVVGTVFTFPLTALAPPASTVVPVFLMEP